MTAPQNRLHSQFSLQLSCYALCKSYKISANTSFNKSVYSTKASCNCTSVYQFSDTVIYDLLSTTTNLSNQKNATRQFLHYPAGGSTGHCKAIFCLSHSITFQTVSAMIKTFIHDYQIITSSAGNPIMFAGWLRYLNTHLQKYYDVLLIQLQSPNKH